jgi:hypothetical protein
MRPQIVIILTIVLSLVNNTVMLAQQISSDSGPPPPSGQRGPEFPIDQGLMILLVLGFLLGIYVLTKKIKANNAAR